ncbi:DUF4114 domain-containing protein [Argonema galeatum]|uniref:DUF4114 domain-containing protein n=1 Tax=Argonema galeatum TaxID=2942762 RepID=UPI002011E7E8|nr:DUF4114 domain-containing protein [Argonema galeatum]MCL1467585.1 DUF4114 domain-containing protein [Argonema galeatum A003/A1]
MSGFDARVFTVGSTGTLNFDYLLDGGGYQGQLAIFNLQGIEQYSAGSTAFIQEAARRILTESNLGHIVIDDIAVGARFKANIPRDGDSNRGTYSGIKTVTMNPGDQFGLMLVPNNTIQYIYNYLSATGNGASPVFSLGTAKKKYQNQEIIRILIKNPKLTQRLFPTQRMTLAGNGATTAWELGQLQEAAQVLQIWMIG